ncbi:MAG: peptidase S8/S53 domain-containing protein [Piptocephalis tieghemiana]|nr:MAG: peptidase S8/S53 domain-containing protein [Piptocephalis tieghemiana]
MHLITLSTLTVLLAASAMAESQKYVLRAVPTVNPTTFFSNLKKTLSSANTQQKTTENAIVEQYTIGQDFYGATLNLTTSTYNILAKDSTIKSIGVDRKGYLSSWDIASCGSGAMCQDNAAWGLAALNIYGGEELVGDRYHDYQYLTRHTGKGVNVYVMDTGVTPNTTEYGSRLRIAPNFSMDAIIDDLNGHGTMMASIIGSTMYGVTKDVQITSVKTFGKWGITFHSFVLAAFQWTWQDMETGPLRNLRSLISLSSVFTPADDTENGIFDDTLDAALMAYYKAPAPGSTTDSLLFRNLIVSAAGNGVGGGDSCYYSPNYLGISIPITAHTVNKTIPSFAYTGNCGSLAAPGEMIKSYNHKYEMVYGSGTSQATAFAAGLFASLLSDTQLIETKEGAPFNYKNYPQLFFQDNGIKDLKHAGSSTLSKYLRMVLPYEPGFYTTPYDMYPLTGSPMYAVCDGSPYSECKGKKFLN